MAMRYSLNARQRTGHFFICQMGNAEGFKLDGLEELKNWLLGLVFPTMAGLLVWYFKRANDRSDKRLDDFDDDFEKIREEVSKKLDREELRPVWEKIGLQDNDIRNLATALSTELGRQIDTLRRESNDHQKQTNDRLDRLFMVLTSKGKDQ